jgi:ABC-type lipoprotein export system ATPase subunit
MIVLKNIEKFYSFEGKKIYALTGINYNFENGKFYAVMGNSGSGKTTLLHIIGTLENPSDGTIIIDENDISKISEDEKSSLRNKDIGFVFQNFYLNNNMKAYENVMLPMFLDNKIKIHDMIKKSKTILSDLGLSERFDMYPKNLSGGEQQRVAIARAIANTPKIIVADEPTANLDKDNEKYVLDFLKKMSELGACVIVSSHNDIIKNYADEIIYLNRGKLEEENEN